jgi:hypothetical protein
MALGYCMRCKKLGSIHRRATPLGARTVDWYPVPHETPASHKDCAGFVELVDGEHVCDVHGPVPDDEIKPGELCDGHQFAIR